MAATVQAKPGDDLQALVDALKPGDELVLAAGVYPVRALSFRHKARPDAWIVIRGADGVRPVLKNERRFAVLTQDAQYIRFANLELTGRGRGRHDAFKFWGRCADIIVEDCDIHDLGGAAINCSGIKHFERLIVRRCHIWRTGGHGEGMYLGHHGGGGPVIDGVFEGNWIHDTGGDQGDGIELNEGCTGNVVRDNVIYNTNYPCIYVENVGPGTPNIVERNVCWNATDHVIQVNGNAIVRNNIVFSSQKRSALRIGPEPEGFPRPTPGAPVKCFNNIVWDADVAMSFSRDAYTVFANNIVDGSVLGRPLGTVTHNYWRAESFGGHRVYEAPGYEAAARLFRPANKRFLDAGWRGDPDVPRDDFDGMVREGAPDIGAYEWCRYEHLRWRIAAAMKGRAAEERR